MGFAKGGADVALQEVSAAETLLTYQVKAQVGGKMAQVGARLIDVAAAKITDDFFKAFETQLRPAAALERLQAADGRRQLHAVVGGAALAAGKLLGLAAHRVQNDGCPPPRARVRIGAAVGVEGDRGEGGGFGHGRGGM